MNTNSPSKIEDNVIVTLNYTVKVDGDVVDTTDDHEPIEFIQGQGHIITGLEHNLYGLGIGDHKEFTVTPAEGYGEEDPDAYAEIPRSEFPPQIPLEPDVELILRDEEGEELQAHIISVGDEVVKLSFNHPLAGKDMIFALEVLSLRWATEEELDHGHVHSHGHVH